MAVADKDTIYIDIDDEITGIIDKLRSSNAKVVALVLPKRAAVFQSIVNMKLLKRAADQEKKHVALITTEAGLLPLAGAVGLYIAKSITSKPEIPAPPQAFDDSEETVQETAELDDDSEPVITSAVDGARPVGELAAVAAMAPLATNEVETVELDNDDVAGAAAIETPKAVLPKKPKKDKSLHVPNFSRFRVLIIVCIVILIALIIGIYLAAVMLPKASITVKTDASDVNVSLPVVLSATASSVNTSNGTIPSKQVSEQKTYTATATASGQQNNGNYASGSITVTNCGPSPATINAGTGFSSGGSTFISQATIVVPASDFSFGGKCKNDGTATVNVTAQSPGTSSNLPDNTTYTIAGNSSSYLTAQGSAMSGGTDNIQQIVTQNDINSAESKITAQSSTPKSDLQQQLTQQNLYPIVATFTSATPSTTTSVNAGAQASNVTVTETINYSMYGARQAYLQTLIGSNVSDQVNTSQQGILSDGLSSATFTATNATATSLTLATTAEVGPDISSNNIAAQAAGKKSGVIQQAIGADPHVTAVSVHLSPFWVTTAPKKLNKITVTITKPTASSDASNQ